MRLIPRASFAWLSGRGCWLVQPPPLLLDRHHHHHHTQLSQPRNLLFMHHKQHAHVFLFPPYSLVATVDKWKQRSWRQQTKQINEKAQTAAQFRMWKTGGWKEQLLILADAQRVIRGSKRTFFDLRPAGINYNDISVRANIVLLTDIFSRLIIRTETHVFL